MIKIKYIKKVTMKTVLRNLIVIALAVLLIAGLSACGGTKTSSITIEDLIAANSTEAVFSKYSNVLATYVDENEFGEHITCNYKSYDLYWEAYETHAFLVYDSNNWGYYKYPDEEFCCLYWFAMSDEDAENRMVHTEKVLPPVLSKGTEYEVIKDVKDNGDGTLLVTTLLDAEHTTESLKEKRFPEELYNYETEGYYTVDKDTLLVTAAKYMILTSDGPDLEYELAYEYDAEMPDALKDFIAGVETYEAEMNDSSTRRKVTTLIYDAGTDKEESYTFTNGYDQVIGVVVKSGYKEADDKMEYYFADDGTLYMTRYAEPIE